MAVSSSVKDHGESESFEGNASADLFGDSSSPAPQDINIDTTKYKPKTAIAIILGTSQQVDRKAENLPRDENMS